MAYEVSYFARIDSNNANNPALNLTGDPATELTFVNETIDGDSGDLFLEQPTDGGTDPDTVVVIDGVAYEFTLEVSGALPTAKKDGSQQVPEQYEGSTVYIVSVQDYPSLGESTRFAFLPDETTTAAEMDSFGTGAIDVQNVTATPPPSPVCFHRGTLIATPRGEVPVESLRAGDLVLTQDGGPRPVRWITSSHFRWPRDEERHKPILISKGALGAGLPNRDLVVSPQHRILLSDGTEEVLAPAVGLTGFRGVRQMMGRRKAEYFHLLLDAHAIVIAEGARTESFFPGRTALDILKRADRHAVFALFPALKRDRDGGYGPTARPVLSRRQAETLVTEGLWAPGSSGEGGKPLSEAV